MLKYNKLGQNNKMIKVDSLINFDGLENVAKETFLQLGLTGEAIVELDFVSESEIRETNLATRQVDSVTDVLSFPTLDAILPFNAKNYPFDFDMDKNAVMLGNIIICNDRAKEQAEEYGHSLEREISYLFLHGLLHLLGFDHMTDADKVLMREKEESVLSKLGINR